MSQGKILLVSLGPGAAEHMSLRARQAITEAEVVIGYSTYIIERLSGFGGHTDRKPAADLAEVPDLAKKLSAIMGNQEFVRASCVGKVELVDDKPM